MGFDDRGTAEEALVRGGAGLGTMHRNRDAFAFRHDMVGAADLTLARRSGSCLNPRADSSGMK